MKRAVGTVVLSVLATSAAATVGSPRPAFGQAGDALKDRVGQLVSRLDAEKPEARDAAEKALVDLGPRVLPLLDDAEKNAPADRKARLARVREKLAQAIEANLGASKVTIQGKGIRLSEAVKILQSRTGNPISDMREETGGDAANPALDLEIIDKPFFEALDIVAQKAGVTLSFFNGDGTIGLMAGAPNMPAAGDRRIVYSGPFRIQFKQIGASRDLLGGQSSLTAQLEVAWEPRLRPMLLGVKGDGLKLTTDDGKEVKPQVMGATDDVTLADGNPAAEVNLAFNAPDRGSKEIASLKVKGEFTIPAGIKLFKFKSLEAKDVAIKDGDVSVTLEKTTVEEQSWRVDVELAYPEDGPVFESFRQGLFNNRIWLQKADGSRFEHNGGLNNSGGANGKLGFEYLFVDVPGKISDYGLVYEAPSKVVTIPLEFEYKKIPLP
jgi:hypothetical protein